MYPLLLILFTFILIIGVLMNDIRKLGNMNYELQKEILVKENILNEIKQDIKDMFSVQLH